MGADMKAWIQQYVRCLAPNPHQHDTALDECHVCAWWEEIGNELLECSTIDEVNDRMFVYGRKRLVYIPMIPIQVQPKHRPRMLKRA